MRKITSLFILLVVLATACQTSPPPTPTATMAGVDPFGAVRTHIERLVAEGEVHRTAHTLGVAEKRVTTWRVGGIIRQVGGNHVSSTRKPDRREA